MKYIFYIFYYTSSVSGCDVTAADGRRCRFRCSVTTGSCSWSLVDKVTIMRSVVGLIAVVAAASLYVYSLSLYLPPAPRRPRPPADAEHADTAEPPQPPDSTGETSR